MKKILILLLITLSLTTYAQKNYSIERPLYLGTVNAGSAADSVLVRGADKIVKFVPRSEFGGGTPPVATIQEVINASPNPDGYGATIYNKKISFDNLFSLFKRKLSISASSIDLFKYEDNLYKVDSRINISETAISHTKNYGTEALGYNLSPLGFVLTRSIEGGGNIQQTLKFPQQTVSQPERVIPISVNGNYADSSGNITIPTGSGGGSQNLQSVLNSGNEADNTLILKHSSVDNLSSLSISPFDFSLSYQDNNSGESLGVFFEPGEIQIQSNGVALASLARAGYTDFKDGYLSLNRSNGYTSGIKLNPDSVESGLYTLPISKTGGVTLAAELQGYTVGTLPTGKVGDCAYVTDASSPTFLATVVGGGSAVVRVFHNGSNWIVQ